MTAALRAGLRLLEIDGSTLVAPEGLFKPTGTLRDGIRPEYVTTQAFIIEIGEPGSGLAVLIPKGYITDLYSLPGRWLQAWQPHDSYWWIPALLHDWLYDLGIVPRWMCDAVLLLAMRATCIVWRHRMTVYLAVRVGGRGGYGKPLLPNYDLVARERAKPLLVRLAEIQAAASTPGASP